MTLLALIRHARSDWGELGRLQGRADRPLSAFGRAQAASWRVPAALAGFDWVSSPLLRARETARLLRGSDVPIAAALVEMDWGDWEGHRLAELRETLSEDMKTREAQGLDFHPPGGESPRQVQARLAPWLASIAASRRPTAAVTHKGVIRAVLGLATGWDFLGKPPTRLDWTSAHLFALAADGTPRLERANIPLAGKSS